MITCTKVYSDIPFAHRQPKHDGHCRHIHGHNWCFEFTFGCERRDLDENGFVIDFGKLQFLKDWLYLTFDHALVLTEDDRHPDLTALAVEDFARVVRVPDASSEGLARLLFGKAQSLIETYNEVNKRKIKVVRVVVREDSKNFATYEES